MQSNPQDQPGDTNKMQAIQQYLSYKEFAAEMGEGSRLLQLRRPGIGLPAEAGKAYDAIVLLDNGTPEDVKEVVHSLVYSIPIVVLSGVSTLQSAIDNSTELQAPVSVYDFEGQKAGQAQYDGLLTKLRGLIAVTQRAERAAGGCIR